MVRHSSKRKKQNQKKSQKIGECHVFPIPVRRITFLWAPWGFDNHNACQVTWAVSELEEHVESALPYPHKEEKNQYTTKLRLQIAINWLKAIVSNSQNWIRMLVWPQLPPPPQAFQVDIEGEIIKTAWASHYSRLKRRMLTSHPNIFINLAQTWHECPRDLDLSYWKHKKGFWEWEGWGNGKMWCQQRMCLGVHMSGFIWSHRLQPWEMLKIWSNTQDWTYSYFRHRRANIQPQSLLWRIDKRKEARTSRAMSSWPLRVGECSSHPSATFLPPLQLKFQC